MIRTQIRKAATAALVLGIGSVTGNAWAFSFSIPWGEDSIEGVSNTSLTFGAQWRMQNRASDLVGKSNLGPVCGRGPDGRLYYQSCQGLFREQSFPAEHLVAQPGAFSSNGDDGNLNYDKGDITQAPFKLTQDLTLNYGDFGLFVKGLFFHDFVNDDFTEHHPNRVTRENLLQVGTVSRPGDELVNAPAPIPVLTVRNDSIACPPERNPSGGPCGLVYGRGGVVRNKRSDKETLRQIGEDFQLLDAVFYGQVPLPWGDEKLSFKLGRQTINWGESTLLFFDSINAVNPPNFNNFFRVGMALEEVFTPVGALLLQTQIAEGLSLETFYQYEWEGVEAPAPGSYWSPVDVGTNNAVDFLTLGFGGVAEDPDRVAMLIDNPLSGTTNSTGQVQRLRDRTPPDGGQYGAALKYYADWLNNGTELGLYYMNYHSRLPYLSLMSAPEGCAKHIRNTQEFLIACDDIPLTHALSRPNHPEEATDDVTQFDNIKFFFDYPRDIQLYGLSFNTTVGDISLQGEVAYRPDNPLQVDGEDLAFMAYGPTLPNCHLPNAGCSGTGQGNPLGVLPPALANLLPPGVGQQASIGIQPDGSMGSYGSSDYVVDAQGTRGEFPDTFDLVIGHGPSVGRAFPSFIAPYRGYTLGTNPPESYVRGWEYFDTYQFNLGGTYVMDASTGLAAAIGSDQIIVLGETGATWVPDLPSLDVLQLEAPGTYTHASAGADGSGSDRSRQACSTNIACSFGPDGLRFNPHQQDLDAYPDKLSYGYALAFLIKYESVLPGISLAPLIIWKHDVHGHSPGVASNFVEGRKIADTALEIRYKSQLSFTLGYTWITGGGSSNVLRDRDAARAFVKYQF